MTSAFLFTRSAFGLLAGFLARLFLAAVVSWRAYASASALRRPMRSFPIRLWCSFVSPDRVAIVTSITQVRRNCNRNLSAIRQRGGSRGELAGGGPFLCTRQNNASGTLMLRALELLVACREDRPGLVMAALQ
jgi:hypothetical protein